MNKPQTHADGPSLTLGQDKEGADGPSLTLGQDKEGASVSAAQSAKVCG